MPTVKRLSIVDCCGERFSKIIDDWFSEPIVEQEVSLRLFPGQSWSVDVKLILSARSASNPYEFDAVFTESEMKTCLCVFAVVLVKKAGLKRKMLYQNIF